MPLNQVTAFGLMRTALPVERINRFAQNAVGNDDLWIGILDGKQMPTIRQVFEEFASRLHFPAYFGNNSAAFDECMADLSWLPARGYCLVITNSENILERERREISWFIDSLSRISNEWHVPISEGEPWDRPGKPFFVVFQYENEASLNSALAKLPLLDG